MRIGVVPVLAGNGGGIYQYSLAFLRALARDDAGDELVILTQWPVDPDVKAKLDPGFEYEPLLPPQPVREATTSFARSVYGRLPKPRILRAAVRAVKARRAVPPVTMADVDVVRPRPDVERYLRSLGIELMIYPAPLSLSFESGLPFVITIHDVQHLQQPEFPEVSADGEWEAREYLFRNAARRATLVLVESEFGREDVIEAYEQHGLRPERVKVLPLAPPPYLARPTAGEIERVRHGYDLPDEYLFYPAQLWPHKNHERIVRALGSLERERGLRLHVVFAGSARDDVRRRNLETVLAAAAEEGVAERVHVLGFVPDEDIAPLYAGALALVMPTFFGPTNIPALEAWALDCPVVTSDIRGIREQTDGAAVLVDPLDTAAIADGIARIATDAELRRRLAERGRERLTVYTLDAFEERVRAYVREAKELLQAR